MSKSVSCVLIFLAAYCHISGAKTADIDISKRAPDIHRAVPNDFFWPDRLALDSLRQFSPKSDPDGPDYNYAREFSKLKLDEVKADIARVIKTSQDWWPSDYGSYAPFFIRMSWHSAGTYRLGDGRGGAVGGQQRFEPLNSWPDNANLDKARRLLWPVKQKYGDKLSWSDLMVLTGNVALESMGFKTFGFAGGRTDDWEPDAVYWGPHTKMLGDNHQGADKKIEKPLGAAQMGLIYVNPQGPNGVPDPQLAANDIRETFGRMAMNDEETVALIAGGHTFGKAHGNVKDADKCVGQPPAGAPIEDQGMGWKNGCGTGKGADTITGGLEGAWSASPTRWTSQYLVNLFAYDWEKTKAPTGGVQWAPKGGAGAGLVPDAHDPNKRHQPMMFTTDIALKVDPEYKKIAKHFADDPAAFQLAFAKAWFKLTHRDMGPKTRYLGTEIPKDEFIWQDPVPAPAKWHVGAREISFLKKKILAASVTREELIRTAWAAAASYRAADFKGGANGARIRLLPQKAWAANNPAELEKVLAELEKVRAKFNSGSKKLQISMADMIVLGGALGIEEAAKTAGVKTKVNFVPGRTDATQEQTDVHTFSFLEPKADGFRNFYVEGALASPTESLIDKASQLSLTVPEMTVLVGGLRVLKANALGSTNGVFTDRQGQLTQDFFVNLLDMSTRWQKSASTEGLYEGLDRKTGKVRFTATSVDLIFGSQSELRAVAEYYAGATKEKFVHDFVAAWDKVMMLDRFDLAKR